MEKEFTVRISVEEHPACFGKDCEGEHIVKYIVLKNKQQEIYYREGHPLYDVLKDFIVERDDFLRGAKEITLVAKKGDVYVLRNKIEYFERELSEV